MAINLAGINLIKYDIRASRTGSNIKIGIYEGANMRSEHTANIANANAFEAQTWDISGVSDANKDAIDKIVITIVNADAANTFYIDNLCAIPVPTVTTQAVSSIGITTATGNGTATDLSGETATIRGFKYGLTQTDTWDTHEDGSYPEEAFAVGITGLSALKLYYVRAYVTSPAGTGYGSYVSFTTLDKTIYPSDYTVELRDKNGHLKQHLTPWVTKVSWEWNRLGGCGRCSITINKAYRDIIFSALQRDDIRIRVKSGATSKLVYRGYIASIVPTLKINQDVVLDVRGYFDLFKKMVVHDSGDTKTYVTQKISEIVTSIADTFITPNSSITKGTIEDGDYVTDIDTIDFLGTVEEALRTLSDLAGDIEYGVDEDLVFYWLAEHTTISHKFFVGDNVSVLERRVKWDDLVNKIYLVGGEVAGVKYKKTAEATDSQAQYYLSEAIINNSSITTDGVANQYMSAILTEKAIPQFTIRAQIKNTNLRLEDTIPLGLITFFDAMYDNDSLGDLIGDIIGAQSAITSSSIANPSVITSTAHGFRTGDSVVISGHTGSTPDINGTHIITNTGANTFTIPINVTTGGTGGVATSPDANGSNIIIGETAEGGSDVIIGKLYSAQVDRISYDLSNTPGRFNIEIQLGDTVLETAAKIKRLELALSSLTQY